MRLRSVARADLTEGTVWPLKHYGPSTTITWDGVEYVIGAGTSDRLEFWRDLDDNALYVVTRNYGLPYIGVERLHPNTCETWPEDPSVQHDPQARFTQDTEEADALLKLAGHNVIRRALIEA